ncbi:MAG: response regulator [Flavisolibacter sp.]
MTFSPVLLCVDDDEDDLIFIKEAINTQKHPFEIEQANDGKQALEFLNRYLENKKLPCLVIMDMNMPKMNGKQTIDIMKAHEHLSRIPVVVFTTSSNEADRLYFESKGIHFLTKPFDYKNFIKEIVGLLDLCADLNS